MLNHAGPKNVCKKTRKRKKTCGRRQEKQALDGQSWISELLEHPFLNLIFKHGDFLNK
jgi:hypothetical protein